MLVAWFNFLEVFFWLCAFEVLAEDRSHDWGWAEACWRVHFILPFALGNSILETSSVCCDRLIFQNFISIGYITGRITVLFNSFDVVIVWGERLNRRYVLLNYTTARSLPVLANRVSYKQGTCPIDSLRLYSTIPRLAMIVGHEAEFSLERC